MRLLQFAPAVLFLGMQIGSCTIFDARGDCKKNPTIGCDEGNGGGGTTTSSAGTGQCAKRCDLLDGEACEPGDECRNGNCVDGVCCDQPCDGLCESCTLTFKVGMCTPLPLATEDATPGGLSCGADKGGCGEAPNRCRCDDGVKNGDETDVDCGGTTCGKPCSTGLSCKGSGGSSCVSGFCVDGYCCNSFCNGTCEACNAPGDPGLCLPVAPGATGECPEMTACSTVGTCAKATTISCVSDSQCATNQCAITCAECQNDAACSNGGACIDGACFNKVADGNPCQADAGCVNGHCVDGVCCATACSGDCMGCHVDYTSKPTGTCAPIRAGSDPHGECSGPGAAATCSGAPADDKGASSCGEP